MIPVARELDRLHSAPIDPAPASLVAEALDGLKFAECVPKDLATAMLRSRLADPVGVSSVLALSAAAGARPSAPAPPDSVP